MAKWWAAQQEGGPPQPPPSTPHEVVEVERVGVERVQEMATAFREEGEVAGEDHQRHMKEVEEVSSAMGEYGTRVLEAARGRFEETREGARNGCSEEYNVMKATMQARIQEVENVLSDRHQAYLKVNGERSKVRIPPLPT
jgi:hypothetical protein